MLWQRITDKVRAIGAKRVYRRELTNAEEVWTAATHGIRGVTLRFIDGSVIPGTISDDTPGLFHEIFAERCYAPKRFYRPESKHTVLDIGANIGVCSVFMSREAPGIRILAFEPHPRTFELLVKNLAENGLSEKVQAFNVAVWREMGTIRFDEGGDASVAGHRAVKQDGQGIQVPCLTLADALSKAGTGTIDLLKIDTEGAECDIIEPAPSSIWPRIPRVVVEYHDLAKRDTVAQCLTKNGYKIRVVPTRGFEHHLGLIYAQRS